MCSRVNIGGIAVSGTSLIVSPFTAAWSEPRLKCPSAKVNAEYGEKRKRAE
ncbi:MAG: hypothetical protein LBD85_05965 [Oscillospiraceae bacterium]|nr:hypothetical protein [Oscillospiraceae bacterium]